MSDLTLTNRQLVIALGSGDAPGGLIVLARQPVRQVKAAYALTKALRAVEGPADDLEKCRQRLLVTHGCAGCPPGSPMPDGFRDDWAVLLDEQVTLPGVRPVLLSELAGVTVSGVDLLSAGPFVHDDTPPDSAPVETPPPSASGA